LFWSGEEAQRLGLVDSFGDARTVARDNYGTDKLADYTIVDSLLNRWSRKLGASLASGFKTELLNRDFY